MIWYNLRLILRKIAKDKVFTMVNICGLTLGIASFLILLLHVTNEKSFDKHFNDSNNIYRVISTSEQSDFPWARSLVFIKEASSSFPEIEEATQFTHCPVASINIGEHDFQQKDIMSVDESFISMFSVKSLVGDLAELSKPNTAFITQDFAAKYFKDENPVGKTIDIKQLQGLSENIGGYGYEIRGIVKNTPPKTHFSYQILLSQKGALETPFAKLWDRKTLWVYNYIKIKGKVPHTVIADKLLAYYNASSYKQTSGPKDYRINLTPITDIHLKSNSRFELKESSSKVNIGLFIMISVVILMVSLLNYINLSTARLLKRSKEMGIKKSVGANKGQLIGQVLAEVFLLCSLSLIIALVSIELLKPGINQFFEIEFSIYYSEPMVYFCIIGVLTACVGFSGIIIGFFLIRKTSAVDLFSKKNSYSGSPVLKSLLIAQVAVVIILISATFLVNKQINFIFKKPLGYKKENVVVLELKDRTKDPNVFASELKKLSQVTSLGFTQQYFGYPTQSLSLEDLGIEGNVQITIANYDYLETMNIELAENMIDSSMSNINGFVINQHLYRRLMAKHGSMEALEKHMANRVVVNPNEPRMDNIIGVAKDFNYNSAHEQIGDFAFALSESRYNGRFVHIRLISGNVKNAMSNINTVWNTCYPNHNFNYFFIDERVAQQYKAETILGRILSVFSAIGILISIIGISALALFISQQRTKEIGIRKVNGAKVSEILAMLNGDFIKWVAIAFVVACPIAYYAMNKWLENFAYKTTLSWWIFALAGVLALGIALLTVSWQSWRAATRNPVEALRYE